MKTNNPIEKDGFYYDKLAVTLAMSPRIEGGRLGMSAAVRLTPYREDENGLQTLEAATQAVVYGDAMEAAKADRVLLRCILKIENALQEFVDAKGL